MYRLEGVITGFYRAGFRRRRHRDAADDPASAPSELQVANQALAREVSERKEAEAQVRKLNEELELRVRARTAELEPSARCSSRHGRDVPGTGLGLAICRKIAFRATAARPDGSGWRAS